MIGFSYLHWRSKGVPFFLGQVSTQSAYWLCICTPFLRKCCHPSLLNVWLIDRRQTLRKHSWNLPRSLLFSVSDLRKGSCVNKHAHVTIPQVVWITILTIYKKNADIDSVKPPNPLFSCFLCKTIALPIWNPPLIHVKHRYTCAHAHTPFFGTSFANTILIVFVWYNFKSPQQKHFHFSPSEERRPSALSTILCWSFCWYPSYILSFSPINPSHAHMFHIKSLSLLNVNTLQIFLDCYYVSPHPPPFSHHLAKLCIFSYFNLSS